MKLFVKVNYKYASRKNRNRYAKLTPITTQFHYPTNVVLAHRYWKYPQDGIWKNF